MVNNGVLKVIIMVNDMIPCGYLTVRHAHRIHGAGIYANMTGVY